MSKGCHCLPSSHFPINWSKTDWSSLCFLILIFFYFGGLRGGQVRETEVVEGRITSLDMEITKNEDGIRGSGNEPEAKIVDK